MHPLVKRLLDMNAYQAVPTSTQQEIFQNMNNNNDNSDLEVVEEDEYHTGSLNSNTFTEPRHYRSEIVSKSSYFLSRGLVKVGIMPRTGTPVLYKSIKQD